VKAESESEHGGEVARPKKGRKKSTKKATNGEDAGTAANKTTKAKVRTAVSIIPRLVTDCCE